MTTFLVPDTDSVVELLTMVFGDGVEATDLGDTEWDGKLMATFVADDDSLVGLCGADIDFAAYSAAALSMMPAAVAQEQISAGALNDIMKDNYYEVMNICSKLFMNDDTAHLRLSKSLPDESGPELVGQLNGAATHKSFILDIPKYGKGVIDFAVT